MKEFLQHINEPNTVIHGEGVFNDDILDILKQVEPLDWIEQAGITGKSGMDGIGPTSVTVGAKVTKRGGRRRKGQKKYIKNDGYYIGWVVKGHKTRGGGETKANDFITPAFNSTKDIATKRIVDKLVRDVLEKNWR